MKAYSVLIGVALGVVAGKIVLGTDFVQFQIVQPLREALDPTLGGDVFEPVPDADGFV